MAPELVTGAAQASHLTDIYALGVVMYYLLTGRLPFTGANTMSVIYQIVNTEPEPPSKHRDGISPELDAIVMKAIAKDPAKRYATWDEFGAGARGDVEEGAEGARRSATRPTPSASACCAPCRSSAISPRTSCGR